MAPRVFPVVVVPVVADVVGLVLVYDWCGLGVRGCCCMRSATISPILLPVLGVDVAVDAVDTGVDGSLPLLLVLFR